MRTEIISIGTLILGFITGYVSAYFNEKGKNKALLEDLKELTEEKEKVTSKFQLDISKRKYKYEDKRNQYFKYFNLLDELSTTSNQETQTEFMPAMNQFTSEFLNAKGNKTKELKAASEFSNVITNLLFKSNQSLIKLKQETATIKLIAGKNVLKSLENIELAYENSLEMSGIFMKQFANNIIHNQDQLKKQELELQETASHLRILKETLIDEIKIELDEI